VALVSTDIETTILVALVYVAIQVFEGNVLVPIVMRNAVGVPPFLVVVSLLVGSAVAGIVGAVLAVPAAAAAVVVLQHAQARTVTISLDTPRVDEEDGDDAEDETATEEDAQSRPEVAQGTWPIPPRGDAGR
jgi:predicted PurR-regulated permease PerM